MAYPPLETITIAGLTLQCTRDAYGLDPVRNSANFTAIADALANVLMNEADQQEFVRGEPELSKKHARIRFGDRASTFAGNLVMDCEGFGVLPNGEHAVMTLLKRLDQWQKRQKSLPPPIELGAKMALDLISKDATALGDLGREIGMDVTTLLAVGGKEAKITALISFAEKNNRIIDLVNAMGIGKNKGQAI